MRCLKKKRYDYYCDCFKNEYKSTKSRIVFCVATSHCVYVINRNKYTVSCHQNSTNSICAKHLTDNMFRASTTTFQQDDLFKRDNSFGADAVSLKS